MKSTIVTTRYGFRIRVNLNDWLGQHVYATGDYEPQTSVVISQLISEGSVVLDVGANIGYFTLLMSNKVGPSGYVYSFEAIPRLYERIQENLSLNGFNNVTVFQQAASDQASVVEFHVGPESHLGISSLRPIEKSTETIRVNAQPLDSVEFERKPITFVKIDVEGAEVAVLRGMRELLTRDRPDVVLEVTDRFLKEFGDSGEELFRMMYASGYSAYLIESEGVKKITAWKDAPDSQFNALFTQRHTLPEQIQVC